MSVAAERVYRFGDFQLEPERRRLLRGGEAVPLANKSFEALLHLVENSGAVIEKDAMMRAIWPRTIVEENNLNQIISQLRRVLGDVKGEHAYIVTVPGKGYSFVANVEAIDAVRRAPGNRPEQVTVAVLPFENLGAGAERDYLAHGLTEETITAVGQIDPEHIHVIGRTSMMRYKGTTRTLAEIGRELDCGYLIESSLRAEGDRLRITSKLIRAGDQVQLWSASYDSQPISMLALQRELSLAIAEQIRLRLSPERLTALARRQTHDAEAYDLYLRGRHYWKQLTPETTRRAIEYYACATESDPRYALAWAGLADAYSTSPVNGDAPPLRVVEAARRGTERAVASEPQLSAAQCALGTFKFFLEWDWRGSERAQRSAIASDPSEPLGHRMLGILLSHMGRHQEATESLRRARELDPFYAMHHALSSQVAFAAGDYPAAVGFARQAIVVDPEFWIGHLQLGQVSVQLGEIDAALEALHAAGRLSGGNTKSMSLRGYLLATTGKQNEAREVLKTLEAIARDRYVPPYASALVHLGLGDRELALDGLERALEVRDVHLIFLTIDPKWDGLRDEARFRSVLKRCSFMG